MLIKQRIYLSLLLLSLLPLVAITILTEQVSEGALRDNIIHDFQDLSREKATAIGRYLDERINETRLLATHPSIIAALNVANSAYLGHDEQQVLASIDDIDKAWIASNGNTSTAKAVANSPLANLLKQLQAIRPDIYGEMFVTDRFGATLAMTKTLSDYYQADEYWWQEAHKFTSSGAFLDDRGYDVSVGAIVVGVVVPVVDGDQVIGIFKINYRIKAVLDIVSGEGIKPGFALHLARSDGSVISSSDESHMSHLSAQEVTALRGDKHTVWEGEVHNKQILSANYPMKHTFSTRQLKGAVTGISGETTIIKTWYVIYEVDHAVAYESIHRLRGTAISLGIGAMILAFIIAYLLSRSITQPLAILKKGTQIIGEGNLTHLIKLKAENEFGAMASAFNDMTKRLQDTLASRNELNNEIVERKQAQEALERFKSTLDQTMDCVFMFDPQTLEFFYVNEGAIEQVGYSLEELTSMTPLDIKPEFDEARFRKISDSLIQGPDSRITFETLHRHKDGHDIPVEVFLQYIEPTDMPPRFLAIVRDITERRLAEEERDRLQHYLKKLFNAMPSIVVGVDSSGNVTHWNQQAIQFTGVETEQALEKPVTELLTAFSSIMPSILTAISTGEELKLSRVNYQIKEEIHYADVLVYPLSDRSPEGAVLRLDDVTERTLMEDMMMQTEKMLSVGGLAGGMAHELNNPIGGMVQGVQNIRRRLTPELAKNAEVASRIGISLDKLQQYMAERSIDQLFYTVANAGERASDIVNNMLRFSRKSEQTYQTVQIDRLLDETVELAAVDYDLKKKFDFRAIHIERDYQETLSPLECIPGELQQVILNLLRNAAQALNEQVQRGESPRITLRTRDVDGWLKVDIEDNGPGMGEETARRAFEPFFSTKPPGQGTGLGLSVSYYIVHDEHGGELTVQSSPGNGARFTIALPFIHKV